MGSSFIKPIQVLTELQISNIDQPSAHHPSMFGFSIKAYSNGVDKFLIIGSPHYTKFMEDEPYNGDVEMVLSMYTNIMMELHLGNISNKFFPRIGRISVEDGYGFEKLAIKFGYAFDLFSDHMVVWEARNITNWCSKYYKQFHL